MDQQREANRRRRPQEERIEPTLPLDMPRAEKPEPRPSGSRRVRPASPLPAKDLFGPLPDPISCSDPVPASTAEQESEPAPPAPQPDPPPPGPSDADAVLLHPEEVLLQRVDARSFKPNERADSWLYWLTDRDRAQDALRDGVPVEPDETPLLLDRPQVLPRLAVLAEDPDFAPSAVAVLRLKRIAVEPFLRPGPGPACYVLSGERKVSA